MAEQRMLTLDLEQAAAFLKCGVDTVREGAASGEIPAAQIGRAWVFVDVDLIEYIRSQYKAPCPTSKNAETSTTPTSRSKVKGLDELLKLPTPRKLGKDATNSAQHLRLS